MITVATLATGVDTMLPLAVLLAVRPPSVVVVLMVAVAVVVPVLGVVKVMVELRLAPLASVAVLV